MASDTLVKLALRAKRDSLQCDIFESSKERIQYTIPMSSEDPEAVQGTCPRPFLWVQGPASSVMDLE